MTKITAAVLKKNQDTIRAARKAYTRAEKGAHDPRKGRR